MNKLFETFDLPEAAFKPRAGGSMTLHGKSDPPPAPDYAAAANATAAGNLQAAQQATKANRVNQYTPYGSSTYTQNAGQIADTDAYSKALAAYNTQSAQQPGGTAGYNVSGSGANTWYQSGNNPWTQNAPAASASYASTHAAPNQSDYMMADPNASWNQTISLSPVGQQLLDASNKTSLQMAGLQGQAADKYQSMLGQALPKTYDPTQSTNNASDLIMARLQPQMQRDQEALRTQLANQGVTQDSTAYNTGMDSFNRQKNDAYQQAQLAGINLGQQQQGQQYSQQMMNRNIPLNDLNAIRSGSQVQNPTFSNVPMQATTGGPDLSGATNSLYGAQTGNVNAGNAQSGNTAAGLFGLAGATSSLWGPALMAMM